MNKTLWVSFAITLALASASAGLADKKPLDAEIHLQSDGVSLTMVAEDPSVCTPTGIDVDRQGRVWVISSHTHFRPDNYVGPEHDEVVVLDGAKRHVFYNATRATMDLELRPDGWVYLAERDRILRVRDSDGDGIGDTEETLAVLDTEADYPHNGLAGLAWHPSGDLIFSLGENFAKPWTLMTVDGSTAGGTGEGGIFRCKPDGRAMRRLARGLWNPFGVCVLKDGSTFAAENDPGARPPCRLLHIVEGGDYGFQRKYGPSPVHPFVCWNGELRGTLPMLHALGEAPCGIVPLGDAGLIVPSWTENRIDFYPLKRQGRSYATHRVVLATGSRVFRPTCIAASKSNRADADVQTFYLADWTIGSYPIHGRGRVWKLEIDMGKADWSGQSRSASKPADATEFTRQTNPIPSSFEALIEATGDRDPFLVSDAIRRLSTLKFSAEKVLLYRSPLCTGGLLAMKSARPKDVDAVRVFLAKGDSETQFEALRWIADHELTELREVVASQYLGKSDVEFRLFEAALACINTLDGNADAGVTDKKLLLARVLDEAASPSSRAFALRLLPPGNRNLKLPAIKKMLTIGHEDLSLELVRWLAGTADAGIQRLLERLALDAKQSAELRAQSITSLGTATDETIDSLLTLALDGPAVVRDEALRAMRFTTISDKHRVALEKLKGTSTETDALVNAVLSPDSIADGRPDVDDPNAWVRLIRDSGKADIASGRRIFFNSKIAMCSRCHRLRGRGGVLGPDLSAFSMQSQNRSGSSLVSFLQPSRDIDPQYFPRILITEDGQTFTGMLLRDGGGGREFYRDSSGKEVVIQTDEVVARRESQVSMMPADLHKSMTIAEIRDLLAFLNSPEKGASR